MDSRLRQIADHLMALEEWAAFKPSTLGVRLLPYLYVLDIEPHAGRPKPNLRIRLVGTALDTVFRRPLRGHLLEEFIHGPRGRDVIAAFQHCAAAHEPLWMRQVMHVHGKAPRFVEGVAVYVKPERIYGGLVVGEVPGEAVPEGFERKVLTPSPE